MQGDQGSIPGTGRSVVVGKPLIDFASVHSAVKIMNEYNLAGGGL